MWQRGWLKGEELERQLAYWREQLGGELPVLELPTDRHTSGDAELSRRAPGIPFVSGSECGAEGVEPA